MSPCAEVRPRGSKEKSIVPSGKVDSGWGLDQAAKPTYPPRVVTDGLVEKFFVEIRPADLRDP